MADPRDAESDKKRLQASAIIEKLVTTCRFTEMVTVYLSDSGEWHNYGIHPVLIPAAMVTRILAKIEWDLGHEGGLPGSVVLNDEGVQRAAYLRYGNMDGFEPLVIDRSFHGLKDDYLEISEEFRLFHRLYHDRKSNKFYKIDEAGNEELVAIIESNQVKIRAKELRQFLAIKEMCLSIQMDWRELSPFSLSELKIDEGGTDGRTDDACWNVYFSELRMSGIHAVMRVTGKSIVRPLPKSKSGMWGFSDEPAQKYVDFIVDLNDDGEEQLASCNPSILNPAFRRVSGHLDYLTPIHFRKSVLDKYYQQPSKYKVDDSIIWCGNLWSLTLDNHQKDQVVVWLGDLGQISYEEQLHWRSHNIAPAGSVSETFKGRQLLNQFTNSTQVEHLFQSAYRTLQESSHAALGWSLLLPLDKADEHHLRAIRVPARDEQKDFDELVLGLTKILIDSLNERVFSMEAGPEVKGGITRLEAYLRHHGVEDFQVHISFLRQLQNLRSSSTAHRKGSNYRKIARDFGIESQGLSEVFSDILQRAVNVMVFLTHLVRNGKLSSGKADM